MLKSCIILFFAIAFAGVISYEAYGEITIRIKFISYAITTVPMLLMGISVLVYCNVYSKLTNSHSFDFFDYERLRIIEEYITLAALIYSVSIKTTLVFKDKLRSDFKDNLEKL